MKAFVRGVFAAFLLPSLPLYVLWDWAVGNNPRFDWRGAWSWWKSLLRPEP